MDGKSLSEAMGIANLGEEICVSKKM